MKADIEIWNGQAGIGLEPENLTEFFGVKRFLQDAIANQSKITIAVVGDIQNDYSPNDRAPRIEVTVLERKK